MVFSEITQSSVLEQPEDKQQNQFVFRDSTTYHKMGCHSFVAVPITKLSSLSDQTSISLSQSWLPLTAVPIPRNSYTVFRERGIIPVLTYSAYRRSSLAIDDYAAKRGWIVQPKAFFYRPSIIDELIGVDGKIKSLISSDKGQNLKDRYSIDLTRGSERVSITNEVAEIARSALEKAGIYEPEYVEKLSRSRILASQLLSDYPFLVHHIFAQNPKLHVLHYGGIINGIDCSISFIRYKKEYMQAFGDTRLTSTDRFNVEK